MFSCSSSDSIEVVDFPEIETIAGEKISSIDPYSLGSMKVIDNYLVIINADGDNIFQIYDVNTDSLIMQVGRRGKGPNEFLNPLFTSYCKKHDNSLEVFDTRRRRIINIDVKKTILDNSLVSCRKKLPNKIGVVENVWYQSDSMICYQGENEGRFSIFYTTNTSKKKIPYQVENLKIDMSEHFEYGLFSSDIYLDPYRKLIVAMPYKVGQIDYYNFEGEFLYSTSFEDKNKLKAYIKNPKKNPIKTNLMEVKADFSTIYVLNLNADDSKMNGMENGCSELLLFDWLGNPIKKYILDRIIMRFAIDDNNQCIYGYAPFESDYPIIKYKL